MIVDPARQKSQLGSFTLSRDSDAGAICETLDLSGIALLPGFLDGETLRRLHAESERLLQQLPLGAELVLDNDQGRAARIDRAELDATTFPAMHHVSAMATLRLTAGSFFRNGSVRYPMQLFVARSLENTAYLNELPYVLHLDREQTLKFVFYLEDVTLDDGPFEAIPGGQVACCAIRRQWRAQGLGEWERPNVLRQADDEVVKVTASAGSLLIFDSDIPHRHGWVRPGGKRLIFRIDSCGPEMYFTDAELLRRR